MSNFRAPRSRHATEGNSGYTPTVNEVQRLDEVGRALPRGASRWLRSAGVGIALVMLGGPAWADAPPAALPPAAQPAAAQKAPGQASETMTAPEFVAKYGKGKPGAPAADALPPEELARRGLVLITRGNQVLGLGSVLSGDGRILTALSPLGAGNALEVRYGDGSSSTARVGHHDRKWDLALLVPQAGALKKDLGLAASSRDPLRPDAKINSYTVGQLPGGLGKPTTRALVLTARRTLLGGDDASLPGALEIGSRVSPRDLGAPVIDEQGRVVAVLGRGCAPVEQGPCTPVAFGIPMPAIRDFLRSVPPDAVPPSAWLGIQGAKEVGDVAKGVRVLVVHPGSPAADAGLLGGDRAESDTILSVGGKPVTTPEELAQAIQRHSIGEEVPLTVFGKGQYRQVQVKLRASPDKTAAAAKPAQAHPAALPPVAPGSTPPPLPPAPAP